MSPFAVGEPVSPEAIQRASTSFAQNASGNVHVFQSTAGAPTGGIWAQYEYPALMANPNVTRITYHIINNSGDVIHVIFIPH